MDRLSTLDAEFLYIEDAASHMHIAGVCLFDDPAPGFDELSSLVGAKLHLIPRYRQRVRSVPLELGRPVWVDDPHFDLGYHLRHTALPAPGGEEELCQLVGRLMSLPLDRNRPLWETWLVEGLEGGRWALVFKVHHCMVDGIAGVELLEILLDVEPVSALPEPAPWRPSPEPSGPALVVDAWFGLVADLVDWAARAPAAIVDPVGSVRALAGVTGGLVRMAGNLRGTPPSSIGGEIGPHRAWTHASATLDDVRTIRRAFGGTVNDVVLAAVAGAHRAVLVARGDDLDHVVVRSMVPVSVRHDDGHGVPDNRVSVLLLELPVDEDDPVERLEIVQRRMKDLKASHMADAGELVTKIGNLAPPMVVGAVSRIALRSMHQRPQRSINTVTTNVPGPQFPLYCLGRELIAYLPFVGISYGVRLSTAVLSYNGRLFFGVTGEYTAAADVEILTKEIAAGIDELLERAVAGVSRPSE